MPQLTIEEVLARDHISRRTLFSRITAGQYRRIKDGHKTYIEDVDPTQAPSLPQDEAATPVASHSHHATASSIDDAELVRLDTISGTELDQALMSLSTQALLAYQRRLTMRSQIMSARGLLVTREEAVAFENTVSQYKAAVTGLKKAETEVVEQEKALKEREAALVTTESALTKREVAIDAKEKAVARKAEELDARAKASEGKARKIIADIEKSLAAREQAVVAKEQVLAAKEKAIILERAELDRAHSKAG